jgi:ariadne-1
MGSDYEFSDDDGDYSEDEEMIDGTQDEGSEDFMILESAQYSYL